jgi:hypothetical protein
MSISSIVLRGLDVKKEEMRDKFQNLNPIIAPSVSAPLSAFLASSPMIKKLLFCNNFRLWIFSHKREEIWRLFHRYAGAHDKVSRSPVQSMLFKASSRSEKGES